jgi:hypothetical protein
MDLSFNPLEDEGMHTLLSCSWGGGGAPNNCLRHLLHVNCNIGNKTFAYLGDLLKTKHFQHLETLSLGMNNGLGRAGISCILEALCPAEARLESSSAKDVATAAAVPALKHLLVPLNNFNDEGLLAIMGAALQGGFSQLETLDISDVGASTDTINVFISNFVKHARCDCLQALVVFGRHPFAQRAIRSSNLFPAAFLRKVKVS